MRISQKLLLGTGAIATVLVGTRGARAQLDVNPPMPNVMLLIDNSGSMEFKIDGTRPACAQVDNTLSTTTDPKVAAGQSERSRWIQLVEVLTGNIQGYDCYTQDRATSGFHDEYDFSGQDPYDYKYFIPYHRPLSSSCTVGPPQTLGSSTWDATNTFAWGSNPFAYHPWNNVNGACTSGFAQDSSGLLDAFKDRARFGMMTFDTLTDARTGLASGTTSDPAGGEGGMWSYWANWQASPLTYATGKPGGCSTAATQFEVGSRNQAAPPWEGRAIGFGSPTASQAANYNVNAQIKQALVALRPFGATPINGMMADASDFFLNDVTADQTVSGQSCGASTPGGCFGPKYDPYIDSGCRKNFIILLTDGQPNLDLRPSCQQTTGSTTTDGVCPYNKTPDEIAHDLANPSNGKNPILTFVVGFAVSNVTPTGGGAAIDCSTITAADFTGSTGKCGTTMDPNLSACCTLAKIAYQGGTTNAHFATNVNDLRSALSNILSSIAGSSTARTLPVFASGAGATDPLAASYSFLSSFIVASGNLWQGVLERKRTLCTPVTTGTTTTIQPVEQAISVTKGDEFGQNVNAVSSTAPRRFYTTYPLDANAAVRSGSMSVRPYYATPVDLVSVNKGTEVTGNFDGSTNLFKAPLVPAASMQIVATSCNDSTITTADSCATRILDWEVGKMPASQTPPLASRYGNAFGDIYHSTPSIVSRPNEGLRDESYTAFVKAQVARPPMLYTATNDGQLHAFRMNYDATNGDPRNNEIWSYFPPAVLPRLISQYPSTHQILLDGVPIVKDVVFRRTAANAKGGVGTWNTVLVAGFGAGVGGYYAVDITNPMPVTTTTGGNTTTTGGPKLLWQLTTDDTGRRLFGKRSATPAITTVFYDPTGAGQAANAEEVAVAILPGGGTDGMTNGTANAGCARSAGTGASAFPMVDGAFPPRGYIHCWPTDGARSLTIVRLDSGEIIRSFRGGADLPTTSILSSRVLSGGQYAHIDSPITGQPVVFPATTGSVAARAFVGDADGDVFRVDLSSPDPTQWKMDLWFDAYAPAALATGVTAPIAGQPIVTPPILSVDRLGDVTVAFSTGDQDTFTPDSTMQNYVWSTREDPTDTSNPYKSKALWYQRFTNGERVAGPMSLFTSVLYFSSFDPTPPTGQVCAAGSSRLWGVDYINSATKSSTGTNNVSSGPAPMLPSTATPGTIVTNEAIPGAVIFGVGVRQRPSCDTEDSSYSDPYLGFGSHTGISSVNPGTFELVVQTGTGGSSQGGATTNTTTRQLPTPPSSTRIDSWAAVVE